ncbi:MAG: DNA repair protein RecN [Lachnospiraceae bacterium]|nr:DNA repair protein RecN [Lachnospiraceae bacterium]
MLLSLHVKNLALIEEEEVTFTNGLNILTGETGAGKSIIIGSINLALGGKADKAIIRTGAEYALIELVFTADNEKQIKKLEELDLPAPEDGTILVKRKILPGRSVCSVCGESVTLRQLREIAELMIDVYGQRENQKLLRREAQLQTVDDYAGEKAAALKEKVAESYKNWRALKEEWDKDDLDETARKREADLLAYECREIEEAALREGEDEELEARYRLMENFRRISEAAGQAGMWTSGSEQCAEEAIDRASRELSAVSGIDPELDKLADELAEVESLLADFNRSLGDYLRNLTFDPSEFGEIQDRLNLINHLKDKYGRSIAQIERALEERTQRLEFLEDYENGRRRLEKEIGEEYARLLGLCADLSAVRRAAADSFGAKLKEALMDLNFPQVEFESRMSSGEENLTAGGYDKLVFYISMNPGESLRPLDQIASGGELSRIMLGLKTVFAGKDEIYAFVFDEIDTGISGKTAWKVAEKMGKLAADHQILCITHLPQIASMQDSHYCIVKESADGRTMTHITRLTEEESDREVARLLGADHITEAALENAREMKKMAHSGKDKK